MKPIALPLSTAARPRASRHPWPGWVGVAAVAALAALSSTLLPPAPRAHAGHELTAAAPALAATPGDTSVPDAATALRGRADETGEAPPSF